MRSLIRAVTPARFRSKLRAAYQRVHYFGFRRQCPLCEANLRVFLPGGGGAGRRDNMRCPVCDSIDRERLLYLYLVHKTNAFDERLKLLHVAPERETGRRLLHHLRDDYISADLNREDCMVKMDVTNMQFPDSCFDAIICSHVLDEVTEDRKAIAEIFRVLAPGGWAILQEAIISKSTTYEIPPMTTRADRLSAFGCGERVRVYGLDYVDRLEQAGFLVTPFSWMSEPESFGGPGNRHALLTRELVFRVDKPSNGRISDTCFWQPTV
jgi:SAM-dependent methyltransferase